MTTAEMVARAKRRLNREEDDDLYDSPTEYEWALSEANEYFYHQVAQFRPEILHKDLTVSAGSDHRTYTLTDDHLGEMIVFIAPGPPDNRTVLRPSTADQTGHYYQQGRELRFFNRIDSDILVKWIPANIPGLTVAAVNSGLPTYLHVAIVEYACYLLAQKPGFLGNPEVWKREAFRAWRGDPENAADTGALGIIRKQDAYDGWTTNEIITAPQQLY